MRIGDSDLEPALFHEGMLSPSIGAHKPTGKQLSDKLTEPGSVEGGALGSRGSEVDPCENGDIIVGIFELERQPFL